MSNLTITLLRLKSKVLIKYLFTVVMPYVVIIAVSSSLVNTQAIASGKFIGDLTLKEIAGHDDSSFQLVQDFSFIDNKTKLWTAPKGVVVNGASIPKFFWNIVGGPWSGKYRKASVIHDHFCKVKSREWRKVHRVFFDAMIASGVSRNKAKVMYYAVYRFGPRWTNSKKKYEACTIKFSKHNNPMSIDEVVNAGYCATPSTHNRILTWHPITNQRQAKNYVSEILANDPSLNDIEVTANRQISNSSQYQVFKEDISKQLVKLNLDPSTDGLITGLIELGLVK